MLQNMDRNNFLRLALIHLLLGGLGRQIGFPTESIDYSNQLVFNRLLLILRSGMTMRLIRKFVCSRGDPLPERTFKKGREMVFHPIFSLRAPDSCFSLGMRFEGSQSFPIMKIEVLDCVETQVALELSTVSIHADDIGSKRGAVDQMLLKLDIQSSKLLSEVTRRVPPESYSMTARRGPYLAFGDIIRGILRVVYNDSVMQSIGAAHRNSITAFAFHPSLRLLATCDTENLKMWYIPSQLANIPVLVTAMNMPPGRMVVSMAFHPKHPVIFIGRNDGSLEMWKAN